jgi:chromosome segregation ATPase
MVVMSPDASSSSVLDRDAPPIDGTEATSPRQSPAARTRSLALQQEQQQLKQRKEEWFKQFTSADGAGGGLQTAYDDACEALKHAKWRQREIVTYLNSNKGEIDRCTSQLQELHFRLRSARARGKRDEGGTAAAAAEDHDDDVENDDEHEGENDDEDNGGGDVALADEERQQIRAEIEDTKLKLDDVKRNYRTAYQEMQICKEQIEEMHSLKKRTMTALLTAFDAHVRSQHSLSLLDRED